MLDLKDINYQPNIQEISEYIHNPIFNQFYDFINNKYNALCRVEYSKDVWARGWNIKLRKAGKSLCVIYPKEGYFTVLVVIGTKEKEKVNDLLPQLSNEIREIFHNTKEGNGQRWLMIDLVDIGCCLYQDTLKLIQIRRESK
jgi:AraC family transcriptional regulator